MKNDTMFPTIISTFMDLSNGNVHVVFNENLTCPSIQTQINATFSLGECILNNLFCTIEASMNHKDFHPPPPLLLLNRSHCFINSFHLH